MDKTGQAPYMGDGRRKARRFLWLPQGGKMASRTFSSHGNDRTANIVRKTVAEDGPEAREEGERKTIQELDRLLAQFDNYFPGFTRAVMKLTRRGR
jgi:hypothetical protein